MTYYIYICFVVFTSNTSRIYIRRKLCGSHMFRFRTKLQLFAWACGLVAREHPHTHLPTSRLAWSSRTMSHSEGNSSAASSSVVAISAANSCSVEADGSGDDNDTHVCVIYLTPRGGQSSIPGFPPSGLCLSDTACTSL